MFIKWERYTKIVIFYDLHAVVLLQDHINPIVCAFFIFSSLHLGIDNYDTKCIVMMDKERPSTLRPPGFHLPNAQLRPILQRSMCIFNLAFYVPLSILTFIYSVKCMQI